MAEETDDDFDPELDDHPELEHIEDLAEDFFQEMRSTCDTFVLQTYTAANTHFMALAILWHRLGGEDSEYFEAHGPQDKPDSGIHRTDAGEYLVRTPGGDFRLPEHKWPEIRHTQKLLEHPGVAQRALPRAALVTLVSIYDILVAQLMRLTMRHRNSALREWNRELKVSEILAYESMEALQEELIETRLDKLLYTSRAEQLTWFESHLRAKTVCLPGDLKGRLIEVTARRNLCVHANAVVNQKYLHSYNNAKLPEATRPKLGDTLHVSPEYLNEATETLLATGTILVQTVWRDLYPQWSEEAEEHLCIPVIFHALLDKRYACAADLCEFAVEMPERLRRGRTRHTTLSLLLNHAQALKWTGDQEGCTALLDTEDWTAVDAGFAVGVLALKDEFDRAIECMQYIGPHGALDEEAYETWPIFQQLRRTEAFVPTFRELFGREPVGTSDPEVPDPRAINATVIDWLGRIVVAYGLDKEELPNA